MRALAILGLLILAGCAGVSIPGVGTWWPGGGPATVRMDAAAWDFRYGVGTPAHPAPAPVGFTFQFPASGEVDYLTTNVSINAKTIAHAVVKVEAVSGTPAFKATDGCTPAAFRIMLEARDDDGRNVDKRWWARLNGPALSAPGNYVMDVSLTDLTQWSNVQGTIATVRPNNFRDAIANLGAVGITFGACAFGHGVSVTGGTARMTVTEFTVQ